MHINVNQHKYYVQELKSTIIQVSLLCSTMLKVVKGSFVSESTAELSLVEQWNHYYSGSIFSVNNKESVPEKQLMFPSYL